MVNNYWPVHSRRGRRPVPRGPAANGTSSHTGQLEGELALGSQEGPPTYSSLCSSGRGMREHLSVGREARVGVVSEEVYDSGALKRQCN